MIKIEMLKQPRKDAGAAGVWSRQHRPQSDEFARFENRAGTTLIVVSDLYPSKEALDEAIASGSTSGWGEQLEQLDALVITLPAAFGLQVK